jgi:protein O-GlcNAcase/histone acetyltransferase
MSGTFLAGVIEGFYGPPWSAADRAELLDLMAAWRLDTYLYAPKDDLKHRAAWREPYSAAETAALGALVQACRARAVRFVYALGPGRDLRYGDAGEIAQILWRFQQMCRLGCTDFALLFDDIPDAMRDEDRLRFGSFAAAQCHVANAVFQWVAGQGGGGRFLFCPTPYCGRMADREVGGAGYLDTIGRALAPGIDILWSGPEIVSREITAAHARETAQRLRRPPVIWDNLFANDYDGRRFFCGPYAGRPPELRGEVGGLLCNPNTEWPLNFVPLRTFAAYLRSEDGWDARAACAAAMDEWLPRFATVAGPAPLADLLLFGDCFYLPHLEGPGAEALLAALRDLLGRPPASWGAGADACVGAATRLRDFCARLGELRDRPLFYALHRRAWELREELDLLMGYIRRKAGDAGAVHHSDFHQPGTYRGGMASRLQRLLNARPDGAFEPGAP